MSEPEREPTLYLVDGTAQLYRAYFALPGLTSPEGMPTNAVFGFTTMLRKLLKDERPTHLAVVFDPPGPTFRVETYAEYKATRPPSPDDFRVQVPYAKQACAALGVIVLEESGFEADDVIATYAKRGRDAGFGVVVVSSDKDLLQLVGDGVTVINPSKDERFDTDGVTASFGVPPDKVLDVQGLMGDSVDNIPGVPGVGPKTAISIVGTYGDLESAIARAARFVSFLDARDALLEAVALIEGQAALDEAAIGTATAACERMLAAARELAANEADGEMRKRAEGIERLVSEIDLPALEGQVGRPGKPAAKPLRPLKKELKALDKGSAKRSWYAIHEHADQARMSRELATLSTEAPAAYEIRELKLAGTDRTLARDLFASLGFKALVDELERDATETVTEPTAATEPVRHEIVLDEGRLGELVEECAAAGRFSIACVTDGGDPMQARLIGIGIACGPGAGAYVPIRHDYLGAPAQLPADRVARLLAPLLADPSAARLAHDAKFQAHLLRRNGMPVGLWHLDTMVAAFLLDSSRPHYALDPLLQLTLGRGSSWREELPRQRPLNQVEVDLVGSGVAADTALGLELAERLEQELSETGLDKLYTTMDGPLLPLLERMEAHGIRVDTDLLARMSTEMEAGVDRLRTEIHQLAGTEFNVDSPKQLREVLFDRMGLKTRRKTAKSKVASTDAQTLEELADQHEIARNLLAYRELTKLKGTYVDSLPRLVNPETGRVHTCFHPTGAATGRLSSSDPNLQNIPARTAAGRQIRSAFVADDGWTFLACDYSQIELRVLAHLTGDAGLAAAFRAGEDIHRFTASKVSGMHPELVSDEMRRRAKAVNFGILYGMSETRLAREQGISRGEARKFIETYFERFASVRGYIDMIRESALERAEVRTLFGRIRRFPQLHGRGHRGIQEQALRAAVNATIQGTSADLMKLAMLRVDRELSRAFPDARILLQVHDELLIEVREDQAEAAGDIVRQAMEQVHELDVPLAVDQKCGKSWLDVT